MGIENELSQICAMIERETLLCGCGVLSESDEKKIWDLGERVSADL